MMILNKSNVVFFYIYSLVYTGLWNMYARIRSRVPLAFISILPGIRANHTEKWGVPLVMYGG